MASFAPSIDVMGQVHFGRTAIDAAHDARLRELRD